MLDIKGSFKLKCLFEMGKKTQNTIPKTFKGENKCQNIAETFN